jgi:hypothetical protein
VKNPNGLSKGVKSLLIDGKPVDGDLAPLTKLKNGSRIVATLG